MRLIRLVISGALGGALLAAVPTPIEARDAGSPSQLKLELTADQQDLLRNYVERAKAPPVREVLAPGAVLPFRVELHRLPAALTVELPAARTYRFVTGQAGIAIVDPADRKVLQILPPR